MLLLNILGILFLLAAFFVYPGPCFESYCRTPLAVSTVSFILHILMIIAAFRSFRLGWICGAFFAVAQLFNTTLYSVAAGVFFAWGFRRLATYARTLSSPSVAP